MLKIFVPTLLQLPLSIHRLFYPTIQCQNFQCFGWVVIHALKWAIIPKPNSQNVPQFPSFFTWSNIHPNSPHHITTPVFFFFSKFYVYMQPLGLWQTLIASNIQSLAWRLPFLFPCLRYLAAIHNSCCTWHNWRITATPACRLCPGYIFLSTWISTKRHRQMASSGIFSITQIWVKIFHWKWMWYGPLGRRGGAGALVPRNGKALTGKTRKQHAVWKVLAWLIPLRISLTTEKSLSVRKIHPPVKEMVAWTLLEIRISVPVLYSSGSDRPYPENKALPSFHSILPVGYLPLLT